MQTKPIEIWTIGHGRRSKRPSSDRAITWRRGCDYRRSIQIFAFKEALQLPNARWMPHFAKRLVLTSRHFSGAATTLLQTSIFANFPAASWHLPLSSIFWAWDAGTEAHGKHKGGERRQRVTHDIASYGEIITRESVSGRHLDYAICRRPQPRS